MKTLFKTNRFILFIQKSSNTNNGNGWKSWSLVLRKALGNGDTGERCDSVGLTNKWN